MRWFWSPDVYWSDGDDENGYVGVILYMPITTEKMSELGQLLPEGGNYLAVFPYGTSNEYYFGEHELQADIDDYAEQSNLGVAIDTQVNRVTSSIDSLKQKMQIFVIIGFLTWLLMKFGKKH